MENWKHLGILLSGLAALITAFISIFTHLEETQKTHIQKIQEIQANFTALINDPEGWVNLRSSPSIKSSIIVKIENGYKVEVIERQGNWFKVKTSLGDIGYIYSNRLQILK